jgi:hypothetical protein
MLMLPNKLGGFVQSSIVYPRLFIRRLFGTLHRVSLRALFEIHVVHCITQRRCLFFLHPSLAPLNVRGGWNNLGGLQRLNGRLGRVRISVANNWGGVARRDAASSDTWAFSSCLRRDRLGFRKRGFSKALASSTCAARAHSAGSWTSSCRLRPCPAWACHSVRSKIGEILGLMELERSEAWRVAAISQITTHTKLIT